MRKLMRLRVRDCTVRKLNLWWAVMFQDSVILLKSMSPKE